MKIGKLPTETITCPYRQGYKSTNEQYVIFMQEEELLSTMLYEGYRHFGKFFFRPCCENCRQCIPIRIPVTKYKFSANARRFLKKRTNFKFYVVDKPVPSEQAYKLYIDHKTRFGDSITGGGVDADYSQFCDSFYDNSKFSRSLEIYDDEKLICVSHFDRTPALLSAIYCYYDRDYEKFGLGKLAIYCLIQYAQLSSIPYLLLGMFVPDNKNMQYKGDFYPSDVYLDKEWVPYRDETRNLVVDEEKLTKGFKSLFTLEEYF